MDKISQSEIRKRKKEREKRKSLRQKINKKEINTTLQQKDRLTSKCKQIRSKYSTVKKFLIRIPEKANMSQ